MESEKLLMELGLEIEIIFVDDGSRDRTMELLRAADIRKVGNTA